MRMIMDGKFIDLKEENNELIINTLSSEIASFKGKETFNINDNIVSIEKVDLENNFTDNLPYSRNKLKLKVTFEKIDLIKKDFKVKLLCRDNEYFFAIQDYFLELINNDHIDTYELLNKISPRIETFKHTNKENITYAEVNNQQLQYLMNYSVYKNQSLTDYLERVNVYDLRQFFGPIKKCFYIILNKFQGEKSKLGLHLISDPEPQYELNNTKTPIAVIVHGLVSSINSSYTQLIKYLQNNYDVYGFDYLTVDEKITDNGKLLAYEMKNLKERFPDKEILVVSHSMGGLVGRSALLEHQAPISKIIMAGTPNNGSILISVPLLSRICLLILAGYKDIFSKPAIKSEDFFNLVWKQNLQGFKDLANKSEFITGLNKLDNLDSDKKYFTLAGKYFGFSNDIIVHTDNMTTINEIKMPHISHNWNHFSYFDGNEVDYYVGKAIKYLK